MAERTYYLNSIPGLESAAYLELCERWRSALDFFPEGSPYPQATFFKGGVEFSAPDDMIPFLLPRLRVCQRLLLRVHSFSAPDEKSFIKGLGQVPWRDFFHQGDSYDIKFSSRSSKISQSRQVDLCLRKTLKPLKLKQKKGGRTLFLRMFRDQCQLSLDLTGRPSYERGLGSVASLRPTTAAALLRVLMQGLCEPVTLVDPMCGSGTFLLEALQMKVPLSAQMSLEGLPLFQDAINRHSMAAELSESSNLFKKVYGFDLSKKAIAVAQKNLEGHQPSSFHLGEADLMKPEQGLISEKGPVVILNPPWGQRLQAQSGDWLKALVDKYEPQRLGLLMPAHWRLQTIAMEKTRDVPLLNSGVENRFVCFST